MRNLFNKPLYKIGTNEVSHTDDILDDESMANDDPNPNPIDDPLHFLKRVFPDEVFEERRGVSLAEFWDWYKTV